MIKESWAPVERLSSSLRYYVRFVVPRCPMFSTQLFVGMAWAKAGCSYPSFFSFFACICNPHVRVNTVVCNTDSVWVGRLTKLVSVDFCVLNMPYGIVKCYL